MKRLRWLFLTRFHALQNLEVPFLRNSLLDVWINMKPIVYSMLFHFFYTQTKLVRLTLPTLWTAMKNSCLHSSADRKSQEKVSSSHDFSLFLIKIQN